MYDQDTGILKRAILPSHAPAGFWADFQSIAILPFNGNIVTAGPDMKIIVSDPHSGNLTRIITGSIKYYSLLARNDTVWAGGLTKISVYNAVTGLLKGLFPAHGSYINSLVSLHDGCVASGSDDKTVKIWDWTSFKLKQELTGHTDYVQALAVLSNGDLITSGWDQTIRIWTKGGDGKWKQVKIIQADITLTLQVLPDGTFLSGKKLQ